VNTGVETFVFWRAGWLLHVHHFEARQPVVFRLGGFALPVAEGGAVALNGLSGSASAAGRLGATAPTLSAFSPDGRGTVLQPLLGFTANEWDTRLDDTTERRHVAAPYHATPILKTTRLSGPGVLAALSWAGNDGADSAAWSVVSGPAGAWKLTHPKHADWEIRHWSLPSITP
jgi:hypothetical protein